MPQKGDRQVPMSMRTLHSKPGPVQERSFGTLCAETSPVLYELYLDHVKRRTSLENIFVARDTVVFEKARADTCSDDKGLIVCL